MGFSLRHATASAGGSASNDRFISRAEYIDAAVSAAAAVDARLPTIDN